MLDSTRSFIIHADANEDFNGADLNSRISGDLFEVEYHSILRLEGFKIDSIWYFRIIVNSDIGCDSFGIFTEWYLLFVDSLLVDTWTHVNIYGWVDGKSVFF